MELSSTLGILVSAVAMFVWALLQERRPVDPLRPRLIPHIPVMLVSAVVILLMVAHLITHVTGQPFSGRQGY